MTAKKATPAPAAPKKKAAVEALQYNPALHKARTASAMLNAAGCGGFDFSTLAEIWGPPKSGKTTFCYQSAELFLEDYGDAAMVLILDAENSANALRLLKVFHIGIGNHPHVREQDRDPRVFIEPAFTFEMVTETVARYVKLAKAQGKFLLVIWDSVTVTRPAKEREMFDSVLNAKEKQEQGEPLNKDDKEAIARGVGRRMDVTQLRTQMLKWALNQLMSEIYMQPVMILLINQATTQFTSYGTKEASGGGYGFKHNIHYSIKFSFVKKLGENPLFHTGTLSRMYVEKSKSMPSLNDVEIFIRDDLGGKLEPGMEAAKSGITLGIVTQKSGGWYLVRDEFLPEGSPLRGKNLQLKELAASAEAVAGVQLGIERHLRDNFQMLEWEYERRDQALADLGVDTATGAVAE
jgi:RecA/RadA recombinase